MQSVFRFHHGPSCFCHSEFPGQAQDNNSMTVKRPSKHERGKNNFTKQEKENILGKKKKNNEDFPFAHGTQ